MHLTHRAAAERVLARYERRTAAIDGTIWFKARLKQLKALMKKPLAGEDQRPDNWSTVIRQEVKPFFEQLLKEFVTYVHYDQAQDLMERRVGDLIKEIEDVASHNDDLERLWRSARSKSGDPLDFLRDQIIDAAFEKMQGATGTLGHLLKYRWYLPEAAVNTLASKLLKKATPQELDDMRWERVSRWSFTARVGLEAGAAKLAKRSVSKSTPLDKLEFIFKVLSSNYSEQAVQEKGSFREFDLYGMKVIVDDRTVTDAEIDKYVRHLDEAYHRLKAKKFTKAWYGEYFIRCDECGGVNQNTGGDVGGHYHIGPDTITCYVRPSPFVVELTLHELGHRWWFKNMSSEQRARFTALVKTHTVRRPRLLDDDPKEAARRQRDIQRSFDDIDKARDDGERTLDACRADGYTDEAISETTAQRLLILPVTVSDRIAEALRLGYPDDLDTQTTQLRTRIRDTLRELKDTIDTAYRKSGVLGRDPNDWYRELLGTIIAVTRSAREYIKKAEPLYQQRKRERNPEYKAYMRSYEDNPAEVAAVSDYGKTDIDEAFAEVFAHYMMNKDMSRDQLESFQSVLDKGQRRYARSYDYRQPRERFGFGAVGVGCSG